jgi:hypothetical protein
MEDEAQTFPLKLPPVLHQRLRMISAEKNTPIKDLIIAAIEKMYKEKSA